MSRTQNSLAPIGGSNTGARTPLGPQSNQGASPAPTGFMQPPGSAMMNTIRKPSPISDDDDDDDNESIRNYTGPPGSMLKPQLNTIQSDDTTRSGNPYATGSTNPPTPMNPTTSPLRNPSAGFVPSPVPNKMNGPANPMSIPVPPSQGAASVFAQIRDPTSRPPLRPVSPPLTQPSQTPVPPVSRNPSPFPPSAPAATTNAAIPLPGPSMNNQIAPIREGANSRIEVDYPIENVLIDANIPSAVAIKINDAVEKDRRGNPIHVHRYTFEPRTHEMNYSDQQQQRQIIPRQNSDGGFRRIREINPQNPPESQWHSFIEEIPSAPPIQHRDQFVIHTDNLQTLQSVLGQNILYPEVPFVPFVNGYDEPVYYYTARALPNDPMRIY